MKSGSRKLLKGLVWTVGGALVLGILLAGLLHTGPLQNLLLTKLNQSIPGKIKVDNFYFSPLSGSLKIKGFTLIDNYGDSIISFDNLAAEIELLKLPGKTLEISEFNWTGIRANLVSDKNGRFNILKAFLDEGYPVKSEPADTLADTTWNFILGQGSLEIDSLIFADQKSGRQSGLNRLTLNIRGNYKSRSGTLSLQLDTGYFADTSTFYPLSNLGIHTNFQGGYPDSLEINFASGKSHIEIKGRMNIGLSSPHLDVKGDFMLDLEEAGGLTGQNNLQGTLKGKLTASGPVKDPAVDLKINYPGGNLMGYQVDSSRLELHLADKKISIPDGFLASRGGRVEMNAEISLAEVYPKGFLSGKPDFTRLTYKASLFSKRFNFRKIIGKANVPGGLARFQAEVRGKGTEILSLENNLVLDLGIREFSVDTAFKPVDIKAKIISSMHSGILRVSTLNLSTGSLNFSGSARADLNKKYLNSTLNLRGDDLAASLKPLGLQNIHGSLQGKIKVKGNIRSPEAEISLRSRNLTFLEYTLGNLNFSGYTSPDGFLNIENLSVLNKTSKFKLAGKVNFLGPGSLTPIKDPEINIQLDSSIIHLEDFTKSLAGTLQLEGKVDGTPANLQGQLTISGRGIKTEKQDIDGINIIIDFSGDTILISEAHISITPAAKAVARGYFRMNRDYKLSLQTQSLPLKHLDAVARVGLNSGSLSLDLAGSGNLKNPSLSGDIRISDVVHESVSLPPLNLTLLLKDSTATIKGQGLLTWNTELNLSTRHLKGSAKFASLELAPFLKTTGQKDLSGTADGNIIFEGELDKPLNGMATVNILQLQLFSGKKTLVSTRNLVINYNSGHLSIPGNTLTLFEGGSLQLKGDAEITGKSSLKLKASLPLKSAAPYLSGLTGLTGLQGNLLAQAEIRGSLNQPRISATLKLKNAGMDLPGIEQSLTLVNGTIELDESSVKFQTLKGNMDKGNLELKGDIRLVKWVPVHYNVRLNAHSVPVTLPGTLDMVANNNLKISGDTSSLKAEGTLTLLEGTYFQNINLATMMLNKKKTRKIEAAAADTSRGFLDRVVLDLAVKSEAPFTVDNNIAFMELKPDIQIKGSGAEPVVSGRGVVKSGHVKWKRREFYITHGIIDFLNPYKTEATIDIKSEMKIQNWLVGLNISGTAPDNLLLKLEEKTASPPLEDTDIISILVTGKTTAQLMGKTQKGNLSKAQMLQALLAVTVSKQLENQTGLDRVDIETDDGEKEQGQLSGVKVTLGKDISRRLSTSYSVESGEEGGVVQRGTAEYKLLENILLKGFQDTEGVYGGAVEWNIQWR